VAGSSAGSDRRVCRCWVQRAVSRAF
jgi:hypothetical protein